jgi:hypothetical protein
MRTSDFALDRPLACARRCGGPVPAGPYELDLGVLHGNVVTHGALRDERNPFGTGLTDVANQAAGRSDEIGFLQDIGGAFGMCQYLNAGPVLSVSAKVVGVKTLVDFAMAFPENDLYTGLRGHVTSQVFVGQEDDAVGSQRFDDFDRIG